VGTQILFLLLNATCSRQSSARRQSGSPVVCEDPIVSYISYRNRISVASQSYRK